MSAHLGPTTIRHKYCCPGAARFWNGSRRRRQDAECRRRQQDAENTDGGSRRRQQVDASFNAGCGRMHWLLVIALILIIIAPLATCTPDDTNASDAANIVQEIIPVVAAAAASAAGVADSSIDEDDPAPPPKKKYKPKPPKRKKGRLKQNKRSSFDYATAKSTLGLDQTSTPMEVTSAVLSSRSQDSQDSNPTSRSPLKAAVKRQNRMLLARDEEMKKELEELRAWTTEARGKIKDQESTIKAQGKNITKLQRDSNHLESFKKQSAVHKQKLKENLHTITSLEAEKANLEYDQQQSSADKSKLEYNHKLKLDEIYKEQASAKKEIEKLRETTMALAQQLKDEKAASRLVIAKVMADAELTMAGGHSLMKDAKKKEAQLKEAERTVVREEARKERQWSSMNSARGKCKVLYCYY